MKIKVRNVKLNEETGNLSFTVWFGNDRLNYKVHIVAFALMLNDKKFEKYFRQIEKQMLGKIRKKKRSKQ